MTTTISGTSGVTFPAGGVGNPAGAVVGTTDTQTLTNKTLGAGLVAGASYLTSGTSQATTSGTNIDFTGIPSWVKRITVMFQGVSLSASANYLVQLGTGATPTYATTGYLSTGNSYNQASGTGGANSTAGFLIRSVGAANIFSGQMVLTNISANIWISSHSGKDDTTSVASGGGDVTLGAVLTAVRITSTSTDTFDAGSINILYE